MTDIQSQLEQLKTEDYQQDQTRLCTMMAFLIGVDWQKCSFYYEQDKALYEELPLFIAPAISEKLSDKL